LIPVTEINSCAEDSSSERDRNKNHEIAYKGESTTILEITTRTRSDHGEWVMDLAKNIK